MKNLLLFFALLCTLTIQAQVSSHIIITGDEVNIREQANTTSKIVIKANWGQLGKVLERSKNTVQIGNIALGKISNFYWYKVQVDGKIGWVFGAFAFELEKIESVGSYSDFENPKKIPDWVIREERATLYYAYCPVMGMMDYRISFFVLLNSENIGNQTKAILLQGDQSVEKYRSYRFKNMISDGNGSYHKISASFSENGNLIIFLHLRGLCELCCSMTIWEGSYLWDKGFFFFTEKYGVRCP